MNDKVSQNFSRSEFACNCGCGFDAVDILLVSELERIRAHFKRPVNIISGNRCEAYNAEKDGAEDSQHTKGLAVDFYVTGVPNNNVQEYVLERYAARYGIGRYRGWTHFDVRANCARWDYR